MFIHVKKLSPGHFSYAKNGNQEQLTTEMQKGEVSVGDWLIFKNSDTGEELPKMIVCKVEPYVGGDSDQVSLKTSPVNNAKKAEQVAQLAREIFVRVVVNPAGGVNFWKKLPEDCYKAAEGFLNYKP